MKNENRGLKITLKKRSGIKIIWKSEVLKIKCKNWSIENYLKIKFKNWSFENQSFENYLEIRVFSKIKFKNWSF